MATADTPVTTMEERVIKVEERCKSNTHRIDNLDKANTALQELATSVKLMAQSMTQMAEELAEQGERLDTLEREPAERWNTMKRTIFTSTISTPSRWSCRSNCGPGCKMRGVMI